MLDLTNEVARNGLIYFPEFCQIVTKKYREEDQEVFRQNMFKVQTFHYLFYCLCMKTLYSPSSWTFTALAIPSVRKKILTFFSLYNATDAADVKLKRKYLPNTKANKLYFDAII